MQFSPEELDLLAEHRPHTASRWIEPVHHVQAFAVVDHGASPSLGEVWLGGDDVLEALRMACRLARSTSIRAGLLGVPRAGAAVMVVDDPKLDHSVLRDLLRERLPAASIRARVGDGLEDIAGLQAAVAIAPQVLTELRARVLDACITALRPEGGGRALVMGSGPVATDAVRALQARSTTVAVWDEDQARARALSEASGSSVCHEPWAQVEVDILVPCTSRPLIDEAAAERLVAPIVCSLMPWVVTSAAVGRTLEGRGIALVPPSLGAAAEVIALAEAEGLRSRKELLALLASSAADILATPQGAGERALTLAVERARAFDPAPG